MIRWEGLSADWATYPLLGLLLHYHVLTPGNNNNNNMGDLYNQHFGGAVGSKGEFGWNCLKVVTLWQLCQSWHGIHHQHSEPGSILPIVWRLTRQGSAHTSFGVKTENWKPFVEWSKLRVFVSLLPSQRKWTMNQKLKAGCVKYTALEIFFVSNFTSSLLMTIWKHSMRP